MKDIKKVASGRLRMQVLFTGSCWSKCVYANRGEQKPQRGQAAKAWGRSCPKFGAAFGAEHVVQLLLSTEVKNLHWNFRKKLKGSELRFQVVFGSHPWHRAKAHFVLSHAPLSCMHEFSGSLSLPIKELAGVFIQRGWAKQVLFSCRSKWGWRVCGKATVRLAKQVEMIPGGAGNKAREQLDSRGEETKMPWAPMETAGSYGRTQQYCLVGCTNKTNELGKGARAWFKGSFWFH